MKKYIHILLLLTVTGASAQIAIGKTSVTNSSVSLEFGADNRGIILPYVLDAAQLVNPVEGTLVFDVATKRIRYLKDASNKSWYDLSTDVQNFKYGTDPLITSTIGYVDNSIQKNIADLSKARAVIGTGNNPASETAPGILILSDTNKAMILPKMDSPHLNIINPAPGMMAYDTKTNQLAVFNGTVWSFWRP